MDKNLPHDKKDTYVKMGYSSTWHNISDNIKRGGRGAGSVQDAETMCKKS